MPSIEQDLAGALIPIIMSAINALSPAKLNIGGTEYTFTFNLSKS